MPLELAALPTAPAGSQWVQVATLDAERVAYLAAGQDDRVYGAFMDCSSSTFGMRAIVRNVSNPNNVRVVATVDCAAGQTVARTSAPFPQNPDGFGFEFTSI